MERAAGSPWQAAVVVAGQAAVFGLFLAFLELESTGALLLLTAACVAAGVAGWRSARTRRLVGEAFGRHRRLALGWGFVLLASFPVWMRDNPYWIFTLNLALLYLIVGLGLNLQTGSTGLVNLAGAAFYGTGAYTAALLARDAGAPVELALIAGALAAAVIGFIFYIPVLKLQGHYLALVTIALGVIFHLMLNNTEALGGPQGIYGIPSLVLMGIDFNREIEAGGMYLHFYSNFFWLLLVLAAGVVWFCRRLYESPVGVFLNTIRDDPWIAVTSGINVTRWKLTAFTIGNALIGLAGGVYAFLLSYIAPANFTFGESLFMLSIVILGAMDSIPGVAVASFVLVVLTEKLRVIQDFRFFLYGVLVVLMLIFRPQGLIPMGVRRYGLGAPGSRAEGAAAPGAQAPAPSAAGRPGTVGE